MHESASKDRDNYFIPDISEGIPDYSTYLGANGALYAQLHKAGLVCKRPDTAMRLAKRILAAVANGTLMTVDNNPLVAYRHVYDNGRIKCPNCSREFIWGYYDSEAYDEIHYCPYCGQRINVVDAEG